MQNSKPEIRNFDFFSTSDIDEEQSTLIFSGIRVGLVQGDITEEKTDAIVNAANEQLKHIGGLAGAIIKNGGTSIQKESNTIIKNTGPIKTGTCCITSPGRLECRQIIHAVGPIYPAYANKEDARELLKKAIRNVFIMANTNGLGSISIPPISSGIFGYPVDLCAKDMLDELEKVAAETQGTLDYVRVTIIDQPTFDVFLVEFLGREERELSRMETAVTVGADE